MSNLPREILLDDASDGVFELSSPSEWQEASVVLQTLRPNLDSDQFVGLREQLQCDGYRLLGVRDNGRLVSVASYTISPHAALGRELLIHDMATVPALQGRGFASVLIEAIAVVAKQSRCGRVFVHSRKAQELYLKNGFQPYSTGMILPLDG